MSEPNNLLESVIRVAVDPRRDDGVRMFAVERLVESGDAQVVSILALLMRDDDLELAGEAADGLVRFGDAALPLLIDATRDERPHTRFRAARSLGFMGRVEALPALETLVDDPGEAIPGGASVGGTARSAIRRIRLANRPDLAHPWSLVEQGRYEQAARVYSDRYEISGSATDLYLRGQTRLRFDDYQGALDDFQTIIRTNDPMSLTTGHYISLGITYWFLGDPQKAVEAWTGAEAAGYGDAAGGVEPPAFLFYAGERLSWPETKREALRRLRKLARRKGSAWPKPIAEFLIGSLDVRGLEEAVQSQPNEPLRDRRGCQASFWIALRSLQEGNWAEFEAGMKRCSRYRKAILELEPFLARWEELNGFPRVPFPELG